MADEDRDEPSLELPSFGFRRRRGKKKGRTAPDAASAPAPEPTPEPTREPEPAPVPEPTPEATPPEPETVPEPEPTSAPAPETETEQLPATPEAPVEQPAAREQTAVQPAYAAEEPAAATTAVAAPAEPEEAPEVGSRKKERRALRLSIGAIPGAVVTGIVVGAATVGLTWGALQVCELVRGASSCGGTGLFLLLLILVAMIFVGAGLLRFFDVPDSGSTSFLAVGLLTVVVLLFLVDLLFNWWMIIVIPCVTLLTYTLSAWVTSSFADSGSD